MNSVKTKELRYHGQIKLIAIKNVYNTKEKLHHAYFLVNTIGQKLHAYDNIIEILPEGKVIIKNHVKCYKDFFVVQTCSIKKTKDSVLDKTVNSFVAISYEGNTLCCEITKWNEHLYKKEIERMLQKHSPLEME